MEIIELKSSGLQVSTSAKPLGKEVAIHLAIGS
jgi:hypothetical protein